VGEATHTAPAPPASPSAARRSRPTNVSANDEDGRATARTREDVARDRKRMPRLRHHSESPSALGRQFAVAHQPRHSLATCPASALNQFSVKPGPAVAAAARRVDCRDLEAKRFVCLCPQRRRSVLPGVEAGERPAAFGTATPGNRLFSAPVNRNLTDLLRKVIVVFIDAHRASSGSSRSATSYRSPRRCTLSIGCGSGALNDARVGCARTRSSPSKLVACGTRTKRCTACARSGVFTIQWTVV
jgi:hypothetical protein